MALKQYGVLKGTVVGHLRDADDDHYQVLVRAGKVMHRIAVNVKSSAPNAPSTLLFQSITSIPAKLASGLGALQPGYQKLSSKPGGLAQDYVRGGLVKPGSMKPVPPDEAGADNDLKDLLEGAVVKAIEQPGSLIYAFGEKWGPEKNRADQYFKFKPGNGIHDIHMNQGNSGKYKKDNGVYQDGGVFIAYPGGKWRGVFLAFQSQSFRTDNNGNPVGAKLAPGPAKPKKVAKRARRSSTKSAARSKAKR
jgi:uncharacterized protein YukJ